jgi:hypothetical protein
MDFDMPNGVPVLPIDVPILGKLSFDAIEWEIGKVAVIQENGEIDVTGIIFRFCFPALPWFKFQVPFGRLEARNLIRAMEEKLDASAEEGETDSPEAAS